MSRTGIACLVLVGAALLTIEAYGSLRPPPSRSPVLLTVTAPFAGEPVRVSRATLSVAAGGHPARLTSFAVDWMGETRTVALRCEVRPDAPCQFAAALGSALRPPDHAGAATLRVHDYVLERIDATRAALPRLAPATVVLHVAPARSAEDGFVLLERAASLCDPRGELVKGLERRDDGWTPAQRQRVDALLAEHAECLAMARRAQAAQEFTAATPGDGSFSDEPTLPQTAVLQWLLIAGNAAQERGEASEASVHYAHMLTLALRVSAAVQLHESRADGMVMARLHQATRSLERLLAAEPRFDAAARAELFATIERARAALDRRLPVQAIVDARVAQYRKLYRPLRYDPVSLLAGRRGEPETSLALTARPNIEREAAEQDKAGATIDRLDALLRSTDPAP